MNDFNQPDEQMPVLWRRVDVPGMESARLMVIDSGWELTGTSVFLHLSSPCRLTYQVNLDAYWQTRAARVQGWVGSQLIDVDIRVDRATDGIHRWWLNNGEVQEVAGCMDIDLNFSPSTNMLPIRRLNLPLGESVAVRAAWLRFPGFTLEPFPQIYHHTAPAAYRFETADGSFTAELTVNAAGFVTNYLPGWEQVGG